MTSSVPFDFVLDYLPSNIILKKMFGMHYIYLGKKIMLILRKRGNEPELNGLWLATVIKHHESLKNDVPGLGGFTVKGYEHQGNWLFLQDDYPDFEEAAIKACELITRGDPRVGRETAKGPIQ
jgi:hypothetical protein